jgi:hypothetical protein
MMEGDPIVPAPLPSVLGAIAQQGVLGLLLVAAVVLLFYKDRELQQERSGRLADAKAYTDSALKLRDQVQAEATARLEDAKAYTSMALKLQAQVIEAVDKMSAIFEELKTRMRGPG